MKKFRVEYMESERGWGQNYWSTDYDTYEEAKEMFDSCNAQNTSLTAPDYYIMALEIKEVDVDD